MCNAKCPFKKVCVFINDDVLVNELRGAFETVLVFNRVELF